MYMYNVDGMEFLIFLLKLRNKLTGTVQNSYVIFLGMELAWNFWYLSTYDKQ